MAPNYQDKGRAQITFRHFWLGGPEALDAANAAECAADQNKFWDYTRLVYSRQRKYARADLKRWAGEIGGMDTAAFDACFDVNKHNLVVLADTEEAKKRGLNSTPSFFINGQLMREDYRSLQAVIDRVAR